MRGEAGTARDLRAVRGLVFTAGAVIAAVGAWLMLRSGVGNIVAAFVWLAGGVVAHDAVLAPVTVVVLFAASRTLPDWLRAPMAAGFVVLATVTVTAIPVLGRFGALPDNPTLLDRNYAAGWLCFAALVAVAVAAAALRQRAAGSARRDAAARRRTPVR